MCETDLKTEAGKARSVFDKHATETSDLFKAFPRGSCGNASLLLGNWLTRCGFKNIQVVLAKKEEGPSHSWLIVGGYIVDITADQFEEQGYGLYPLNSEYHAAFSEQEEGSLDLGISLEEPYEIFSRFMEDA
ncbi:MAG: hypothetical protein JAY97_08355 [Candidatus Thiodiazotropha sp. 'RUGA']|nr:hypothetical protein [Candidatus Thiodiazotropha sp. 'RUGA']